MRDLYLKQLRLRNFCNYEEHTFSFLREDGTPYPFICFFGPNGAGKSTILEAISLLSMNVFGRGTDRVRQSLLKYVHNEDYDPIYNRIGAAEDTSYGEPKMLIEGIYVMNNTEYVIQMNELGWLRNDFAPISSIEDPEPGEMSQAARSGPWKDNYLRYLQRITHFVSSDNDLSLNKFQLVTACIESFEKIITEIMRWPAKCILPSDIQGVRSESKRFCTDFVIQKKKKSGKVINVHFKRMSAGEKKITKSFSDLFNLIHTLYNPEPGAIRMSNWPRLLLIDNVEMHAYFDRHVRLVNSLKQIFNKHQIFSTTHSGVLIKRFLAGQNDTNNELFINLEDITT